MADSRAKDLTKRVINSLASITGVRLWSDKEGDADATGVELSELMSSGVVGEASTLDYQALTPKGFGASVATESRKGITEHATPSEVDAGAVGNLVIVAEQLKRKLDELKVVTALSFSGTPNSGIGSISINGKKCLNTISFTVTCFNTQWGLANKLYLATIDDYVSPGYNVKFSFGTTSSGGDAEVGHGVVETDGKIYLYFSQDNRYWAFTLPIIMGTL